MKHAHSLLWLLFLSVSSFSQSRKLNNKDAGTFVVYPHVNPVVTDTNTFTLSIKIIDISGSDCKKIEGNVKIKDREYFVYDSSSIPDNSGSQNDNYFEATLPEGEYDLKVWIDKNYYPVKTEKLFLRSKLYYEFTFYVIRKDIF